MFNINQLTSALISINKDIFMGFYCNMSYKNDNVDTMYINEKWNDFNNDLAYWLSNADSIRIKAFTEYVKSFKED